MTRRRLDLRLVRRALRSKDRLVLLGNAGGFDLQWIEPDERTALWARVSDRYAGPDGDIHAGQYMGYEFVHQDGRRLVYLEVWC